MTQKTLKEIFNTYSENKINIFKNKDALTDKYIPENIPHREEHINQIGMIIAPAVRGDKISNIFVYGSTGTGKSVTLKYITKELEKNSDKVKILYVNCKMKRVSDTEYRLLVELSRLLGKEIPPTGLPTDQVYRIFFETLESQNKTIILILDEIDAMVKKVGDDILYTLTRLNQDLIHTKLSIVGISNDTSFTEKLDPRVKSSLSEEEIIFHPYDAKQLTNILTERSKNAFSDNVVDQAVITKCAALAAQEHGDARRALDLLRISGELAERQSSNKVTTEFVDKAEERLDLDRITEVVRAQPRQSQAVLASIIKLVEGGHKNIQTGDVFSLYEKICHSRGLKILTQRRLSDLIGELDMLGIINAHVISKGRYGRTREIKLHLSKNVLDKIKQILKDNYLITDGLFLDRHG